MIECNIYKLKKGWLQDIKWKISILFSEIAKVIKILEWPSCRNVSKVRTFIDVCIYYRIWVINFVIIASSIYCFLKIEEPFVWIEEQKNVMNILKLILTTASTLRPLNYSSLTDEIILAVDFNLKKWDIILSQINFETSKNHSSRYKSDLWTIFESKYDVIKRECWGLLKTLKKVRFKLYKIRFIIEIDVNTFVVQFNRSIVDLSEILIIRWLTWIRLFDSDVRYVLDKKHTTIDELSWKLHKFSNDINKVHEKDINDSIDNQFNCMQICLMQVNEKNNEQFLKNEYFEKFEKIAHYLITLTKFNHSNWKRFRDFKNWALQFLVRDKYLFKRINKNVLLWKIINEVENQTIIWKQLHDENEYRERERIYRCVTNKYWWQSFYRDCEKFVVNCESCQLRALNRKNKRLHFIWISSLFQKINIDCVHLFQSKLMKVFVMIKMIWLIE